MDISINFSLNAGGQWFRCSEAGKSPVRGAGTSFPSRKLKVSLCSLDKIFQSHGRAFPTPKLEKKRPHLVKPQPFLTVCLVGGSNPRPGHAYISGALVEDGDTLVKSLHSGDPDVIGLV
jgi:hypothetical protein